MSHATQPAGYDPARLVADAVKACRAVGLHPTVRDTPGSAGAAIVAACQLLRSIGVTPVDANGRPEQYR